MIESADSEPLEVDTGDFEDWMSETQRRTFDGLRSRFVRLIRSVVQELGLRRHLRRVAVSGPTQGRACLYRPPNQPWPSEFVCLEIYLDDYMNRRLLRHEFGHEADRWNPRMQYDGTIETRFRDCPSALDCAANISLDARLGRRGLGRNRRRSEFVSLFGENRIDLFDNSWANPPLDWPAIERLARVLVGSLAPPPNTRFQQTRRSGR